MGQLTDEVLDFDKKFQSTHPVRGGTTADKRSVKITLISIHPPRAGWDFLSVIHAARPINFNPPTPCGVGRWNSTGATGCRTFQSTHPVRGGTDGYLDMCRDACISIHPPRAGWDPLSAVIPTPIKVFQSTHPVRGGTPTELGILEDADISIHPPRAGWDAQDFKPPNFLTNFNPPTPCGVGLKPIITYPS